MAEPCRRLVQRPIAPRPTEGGRGHGGGDAAEAAGASRARVHTAEQWAKMQPVIKRLYVTEHRKLAEVMTILERQYGFKAT